VHVHLASLTSALRNTQHVPLKPSTHSTALPWIIQPPLAPSPLVLLFFVSPLDCLAIICLLFRSKYWLPISISAGSSVSAQPAV